MNKSVTAPSVEMGWLGVTFGADCDGTDEEKYLGISFVCGKCEAASLSGCYIQIVWTQ